MEKQQEEPTSPQIVLFNFQAAFPVVRILSEGKGFYNPIAICLLICSGVSVPLFRAIFQLQIQLTLNTSFCTALKTKRV